MHILFSQDCTCVNMSACFVLRLGLAERYVAESLEACDATQSLPAACGSMIAFMLLGLCMGRSRVVFWLDFCVIVFQKA